MRHVTEFTFITCMHMLNGTLRPYNTLSNSYLLVNITYTTLTAYITLHDHITLQYTTLLAYIHRLQYMT